MTMWKWSKTAATNSNADSTINWAEGQAPSSVNDSARALMAAAAKARDDHSGMLNTGGSSTAYTITSNQGLTALTDGFQISARLHAANGASPTLAVDGLTAKPIRVYTDVAVPTGAMALGTIFTFTYDSGDDCWYVHGYFQPEVDEIPSGSAMLFIQTSAPSGWTKSTTHNNKALRIVSGTASSGGSTAFTSVFTSRTPTGTVGGTTLSESQIPAHRHFGFTAEFGSGSNNGELNNTQQVEMHHSFGNSLGYSLFQTSTEATVGRSGPTGGSASHDHSFTGGAMDFAVQYVDAIIATKD